MNIHIPPEIAERLGKIAKSTGRTLNDVAIDVIERWLYASDIRVASANGAGPTSDGTKSYAPRPKRMTISPEESLRRMADFPNRKDDFIASIRKSKG